MTKRLPVFSTDAICFKNTFDPQLGESTDAGHRDTERGPVIWTSTFSFL
jgi:hypothetical protein